MSALTRTTATARIPVSKVSGDYHKSTAYLLYNSLKTSISSSLTPYRVTQTSLDMTFGSKEGVYPARRSFHSSSSEITSRWCSAQSCSSVMASVAFAPIAPGLEFGVNVVNEAGLLFWLRLLLISAEYGGVCEMLGMECECECEETECGIRYGPELIWVFSSVTTYTPSPIFCVSSSCFIRFVIRVKSSTDEEANGCAIIKCFFVPFFCLRHRRNRRNESRATRANPPIVPPTIPATFRRFDSDCDDDDDEVEDVKSVGKDAGSLVVSANTVVLPLGRVTVVELLKLSVPLTP